MLLGLIIGFIYSLNISYWVKWAVSLAALYVRKYTRKRTFDLYDFERVNQPEKLGVLIPNEERELESPFPEEQLLDTADEIFMYGVNSKSEALLVRIARTCNDESEAWLYLRLSDGRWYELEQTAGFQRNFGGKCTSFTCGGLQMHCMEPMRRWRIVYCGMLRERKGDKKMEEKRVFVKFTFIWTASSEAYEASNDLDIRATASAMAKTAWKSLFPPINRVTEIVNFYSQSGVMAGIVSIKEEQDIEMYLYGERMRFMGKNNDLAGCKFKHVLGVVLETGLVLHLGKVSAPNALHNLNFGFTVEPNGLNSIIEEGLIISNLSGNDPVGKNLKARFKAGNQYELQGNFIGDVVNFDSKQGRNLKLIGTEFEIDGYKGSGFMISGQISEIPQEKIQMMPSRLPSKKPLTVYFTDDESQSTELTGGKGSSLSKLTKLSKETKSKEFLVPKGIIVTTAAYEKILTTETLKQIDNLKNVAYGNTKEKIPEACKKVALAVESSQLPDQVAKEIEEKLFKLFGSNMSKHRVAVRSSATGEDTDQMSAAGQMDTFLGVQGLKEILTSVKKCWASQFSHIAVEYKRQNGQILNSPMAVVIQEMVDCEAAGVIFTCDPVTNNPSVVIITGNYGLGESVVSGSEEPDTVTLQKLPSDEVEIKYVALGLKQHKIVMRDKKSSGDEVGTLTEEVPQEEKNKCCISEEMMLKLGKLSLKIENHFKSPRDIEWGIKHDSIYILQSRPITTGGAISDYEIKHEFDSPLRCDKELFTMSNVGEVLPGAMTPLGIDVTIKYFSIMMQQKLWKEKQRNNFMQSKYYAAGVVHFYNHVMMTVADSITRLGDVQSLNSQGWMIGIFGRLLEDDLQLDSIIKHRRYKTLKNGLGSRIDFYMKLFFSWRGIEKLKERIFNYEVPAEKGKTAKEIFKLLTHSCSHHVEPFSHHMICTGSSMMWNMYMFGILSKANGGIDNAVYSDFAKLLASTSNVESADIPSAMQELAHLITKEMKSEDFKAMSTEEAQEWLDTSRTLAGYKYRQFLKRHGHRCLKEYDIHSLPWDKDRKALIRLLQNMSGFCEDIKVKKQENFSDILPHLAIPLNLKSRMLLKFILPNCQRGVREREICKSIFIKAMDNEKKGYWHLSSAMVSEGFLPDADLMFFLTINEIRDLLDSRNPKLIARANHRRKLFPTLDAFLFPEISRGRPVPTNETQDIEEVEYIADLTMKGIPVSQGTIKGYARVALSLNEASDLKPGEILITYSTDIGWSPYFPILSGVVTELGGLVSHGAVVSREYGLPCVVGLHGATKQFITGDYVHLDGNKGILQRLSTPEN